MQFTLPIAALVLASTAAAAPADLTAKSTIASGNSPGSIFMFGDAQKCRQIFEDSGACGLSTYFKNAPNLPLVALPSNYFDKYGPENQHNKLCGHVMTMTHKGISQQVVIADTNTSDEHSIDMCLDSWQKFGGHDGDGTLITDISWSISS